MGSIDIDNEGPQYIPPTPSGAEAIKPQKPAKKALKVPNFPEFRKKLFFGIGGGVLFIAFLIWAIWFAPAATVIVTAKTEPAPVSMTLTLGGAEATNVNKNIVSTVTKQIKKDVSVDFTATGKKKLGDKASGTMTLSNGSDSNSKSVPAGSVFSSNGLDFVTTSTVSVPGAYVSGGHIVAGQKTVAVSAAEVGSEYNLAAGSYQSSVDGITAYGSQMSGGNSHDAVVVTQEDILKAGQALVDLPTTDVKQQLTKQFSNGETVIADSFDAQRADAVSSPLLGEEVVNGKAKLTSSTTFTLSAIAKSELESFLREAINKQISGNNQRVYSDGIDKVTLSGYVKGESNSTVNVAATGQIGPNIDQNQIKNQVKGKNFGDTQALLSGIQGVSNVDVKFSYFWVTTIPGDTSKIEVKFVIDNA
jgi:hypothetical protein